MAKRSGVWYGVLAVCVLAVMFTGCSRDPNKRKKKYLESGQRYYDKGKYREAAIQFENAIQVDGRFAEAYYKLAQSQMKQQHWSEAFQPLSRTVELQPDNYAAQLDIVSLEIASRQQLADAKERLDLLQQKQPANPEVFVALANYHAANNDMGQALAAVQKAVQLSPNRSETYLNMALLQVRVQQWDAAEVSYRKAVEIDPKSTNALISLGNFFQVRGRFPEAEQQFRRAIENAPSDPEPRGSLARLYLAQNKFAQAEEFLKQSKKDFPDNSLGYRMLADFYFANNRLDQATAEYAAIYQEHPKDITVKKYYVQALILKNQLDEAQKLNDEVLKGTPGDTEALICRGQIELRRGKASAAVNTLQGALKNEPGNAVAHYQLGLAFDQSGNLNQAEAEWREAVRLQPGLADARRHLATVAIRRNDAAGLALEADQIIEAEPESPDGYLLRAVADIDRKQFASAEDNLKRSLQKSPDNAPAYVQLGNLRVAQNNLPEAQKAFQQALDQDPNSTDALGGVLNVYLQQKQGDKALALANAQLAKYPNNVGFQIIVGRLLFDEKKDAAGAEAAFRRAAELDKNNIEALVSLGRVQAEAGKPDQALQTYLDAARDNPNEVVFNLLAGGIYWNRQDWEKAKKLYQRVLELQPDNPVASNNLAFVMLEQGGNVDVAMGMAQTARRQLPDNATPPTRWVGPITTKAFTPPAIDLFKQAVKKEPDNATYNYHLGLAYARNGQAAQARQQLDRILKIKPDSSEANELKQALAQIKG